MPISYHLIEQLEEASCRIRLDDRVVYTVLDI